MNNSAMTAGTRTVSSREELLDAAGAPEVAQIQVAGTVSELPSFRLAPGQQLRGGPQGGMLRFAPGEDGIEVSSGNTVADLTLTTDPDRRALFNDTRVAGLGRTELSRLAITGNVRLLLRGEARSGHLEAHDIQIAAADARGFGERPSGFGVEVVPGVFTIWNLQEDPDSLITADLSGLTAGQRGLPVRGSGIFVGGTPRGGRLLVRTLETNEIHADGGISEGTPDRISGGVFVVHGAWVDRVRNAGAVTTYGPNDMVLDNWGTVERWHADEKITSYGASGIGFVNFGTIGVLRVDGAIETFGRGARGFNVYAGTVRDAEFERIITRADGAVGVQISQPIGRLAVRRGIETHGGIGSSLVKGVITQLPATALSIKPGGSVREIAISGGLLAHGENIEPIEMHGIVESFQVSGGFRPEGGGFSRI